MPRLSRSCRLVKKAECALMSGIEVYNKPTFAYREETFTILAINAWELLLKAKLLAENSNDLHCLYSYEKRNTKTGQPSKKQYVKRNRSGNIHTIGLLRTIAQLDNHTSVRLSPAVKSNLDALIEIRDNAVHFPTAGPILAKQVLEIGTASVRNFVELMRRWFGRDLSGSNFYLMPIGFLDPTVIATALQVSSNESNLIRYLAMLVKQGSTLVDGDFHVSLEVDFSFKRSSGATVIPLTITNDQSALNVTLSDEDIRKIYNWDYHELTKQLYKRYIDFKANQKYHTIRKPLMSNPRFVKSRYLDPDNPKSAKKDFYNPNILAELDKYYNKRQSSGSG